MKEVLNEFKIKVRSMCDTFEKQLDGKEYLTGLSGDISRSFFSPICIRLLTTRMTLEFTLKNDT